MKRSTVTPLVYGATIIMLALFIVAIVSIQTLILMYGWNIVVVDTMGVEVGKLSFWTALLFGTVLWTVGTFFRSSSGKK